MLPYIPPDMRTGWHDLQMIQPRIFQYVPDHIRRELFRANDATGLIKNNDFRSDSIVDDGRGSVDKELKPAFFGIVEDQCVQCCVQYFPKVR